MFILKTLSPATCDIATTATNDGDVATVAGVATHLRGRNHGSVATVAMSQVATLSRIPLSCLAVCTECTYFRSRPQMRPDGWCLRFSVETWGRVPFRCEGFKAS